MPLAHPCIMPVSDLLREVEIESSLIESGQKMRFAHSGGLAGSEGTLVWLNDRQELAVRTNQGWRQIQVSGRHFFVVVVAKHFYNRPLPSLLLLLSVTPEARPESADLDL